MEQPAADQQVVVVAVRDDRVAARRVRRVQAAAAVGPAGPSVAAAAGPAYPGARRGSLAVALAAAASETEFETAVDDFIRDRYAPKSNAVRATWLRTWLAMHNAAFPGPDRPPPFPLTPLIICKVSALFK